jgi:hypothetical protein
MNVQLVSLDVTHLQIVKILMVHLHVLVLTVMRWMTLALAVTLTSVLFPILMTVMALLVPLVIMAKDHISVHVLKDLEVLELI